MIHHLVLFNFSETASPTEVDVIFDALAQLKAAIPEVQTFTRLHNISKESFGDAYPHGFLMTFLTTKARDTYVTHPAHTQLAKEKLLPLLSGAPVVFDYLTPV